MDVENKTNSCPHTQIDISKEREIISCDNLSFPWNQDPRGYFLVKIEEDLIKCGFVNPNHEMIIEFQGVNPDKMIKEIVSRNLCSNENLAYISSELIIAHNCIENNLPYVQR